MRRPTAGEQRRLRSIRGSLAEVGGGGTAILAEVIQPIGELLGIDDPCTYRLEVARGRFRCAFAYGGIAAVARDIEREASRSPVAWTGYNLFCPEPDQRNRTMSAAPERIRSFGMYSLLRRHGREREHQIRALVCDGPMLLAWVGGFHGAPITARQHALLDALVPALRRRLQIEHALGRDGLVSAALDRVLDQLGVAAFLLGGGGRVEHANARGWDRLAREGHALSRRLHDATRRGDPDFEARPIAGTGHAGHLVLERPADRTAERARAAAAGWGLTRRQTQVLELVAAGHTNARIGAELCIAPGTVELHVSAILARADVDTRAALVAALWSRA